MKPRYCHFSKIRLQKYPKGKWCFFEPTATATALLSHLPPRAADGISADKIKTVSSQFQSHTHTHTQHKGKNGCNFLGYSRCQLQYTKRIKGSFGWLHLSKNTSKQEVHNSLQLLQETTTFKFSIRTRKERNPVSSRPTQASLHHHPIQYPNQRSTPKQAPKQTTQVRLGQSHQVQTLSSQPPAPQTR